MQYLNNQEVKRALFELLCRFDSFAQTQGLRYTLLGGTLLGAVRHRGFIPWDDDVDVGMPRPDYERLLELSNLVPSGTALVTMNDASPRPFTKFVNVDILCQEQGIHETECLWVDVFPLDGMPDDDQACMDQLHRELQLKINAARRRDVEGGVAWKRPIKAVARPVLNAIASPVSIYRKMDKIAQEYPFGTTRRCRDVIWGESPTAYYLTDDFDHLARLEFCGREFPAVAHWDETLKSVYGDYMTLPPQSQRVNHGLKAWYIDGGGR